MPVQPIPEGYHTVTPYLVVKDAAQLIDYVKSAFGATETVRMPGPDGSVMHAEVRIGNSMVMMGTASAEHPATSSMVCLYVEDVDAVYGKAVAAGGKSLDPPKNQFYGDRSARVADAFGNQWWIGTHVEDVAPEEMERRMKAAK